MSNKLRIFEEDSISNEIIDSRIINIDDVEIQTIKVYEQGPKGDKGDKGEPGFSGAGEPFYAIVTGEIYATTASIAINAFVSSSILPWSSSFDLGSITNPWKNIYVSNSLFVGNSKITTSSFGFENYNIQRISSTQEIFKIRSGSVSASFNNDGIFIVSEFNNLPNSYIGGLIISGGNLFVGLN